MSTYVDQSATNPDISPNGTPRAPRSEFQLFNLGGGPSKKLDDETLETRVRQRSRFKSLISPQGPCSPQARPILVLGEVGVDRSDAEVSRRRLTSGRCRPILESRSTNATLTARPPLLSWRSRMRSALRSPWSWWCVWTAGTTMAAVDVHRRCRHGG